MIPLDAMHSIIDMYISVQRELNADGLSVNGLMVAQSIVHYCSHDQGLYDDRQSLFMYDEASQT